MASRASSARDSDVVSQFVEKFAAVLTETGFPRMPARLFAALLASDSGTMTARELAGLLRISPAAISGAVRYLTQVNLVSREHAPGSRREHYRVHSDVWYEAMARRDRVLSRCEQSLRHGSGCADGGDPRVFRIYPGRVAFAARALARAQAASEFCRRWNRSNVQAEVTDHGVAEPENFAGALYCV